MTRFPRACAAAAVTAAALLLTGCGDGQPAHPAPSTVPAAKKHVVPDGAVAISTLTSWVQAFHDRNGPAVCAFSTPTMRRTLLAEDKKTGGHARDCAQAAVGLVERQGAPTRVAQITVNTVTKTLTVLTLHRTGQRDQRATLNGTADGRWLLDSLTPPGH